jgi:cytochrome c-type protein NapB
MKQILGLLAVAATLALGCVTSDDGVVVPGHPGATKTAAVDRALRRAYDGAPPTIPHEPLGVECIACHTQEGMSVPDLGFAPASPHEKTEGMSAMSRCQQCHVFRRTKELFVESAFAGFAQDLRHGKRLHDLAPPVIPHKILMRENCVACHAGPAAREEIRTSHPERVRCRQCHAEQRTTERFVAAVPDA